MNGSVIKNEVIINWARVLKSILKKWWLLLLCLVIGAVSGFGIGTYLLKPEYVNSICYVVSSNGSDATLVTETQNNSRISSLLNNCIQFISGDLFYEKMTEELNYGIEGTSTKPFTSNELNSAIKISRKSSTNTAVSIEIKTGDRDRTNRIAAVLDNNVEEYINNKYTLSENERISFDRTNKLNNTGKTAKLSPILCTLVGGVGFVGLTAIILLIKALTDSKVYDSDDIKNRFNAPILGNVPNFGTSVNGGYEYYAYKKQ